MNKHLKTTSKKQQSNVSNLRHRLFRIFFLNAPILELKGLQAGNFHAFEHRFGSYGLGDGSLRHRCGELLDGRNSEEN